MLFAYLLVAQTDGLLRAQERDELEQLFENSIRPVLTDTCFSCHGDPNAKLSGGLRVDSREALLKGGDSGPAIDLQKPEESLLLKAIARAEGASPMPPNNDRALRSDQLAKFKKWIESGAAWPAKSARFESRQHWAFQSLGPRDPALDIDHWLRVKQTAAHAKMAPPADRRTLIRRATFDLTGLPPTFEQVEAFVNDPSPQAYAQLIDRLLDSPSYGERWARHWLDIVRYADTAGETADYPVPNAWRYRNYVIEAFQQDKPYDQFLREQIAGDILADDESTAAGYASKVTATGYLAISRRFGFDSENYHHLTIQDTIDTLGQSVLGLSLGCARCHDHKFDPISMQDYYALYGIFDSSRYAFPGSEQKQKVRSMMPLVPARQALVTWRKFDERIGSLRQNLERNGQPTTPAVLRMLNDMDGDFELQAPAAGGSNGVLVPPWMVEGPVAVTNGSQSPFRNVYGQGKAGIRIDASDDNSSYRVWQALTPRRTPARDTRLQFSLDFRVPDSPASSSGNHQLWLGGYPDSAAVAIDIGRNYLQWNETSTSPARSLEFEPGKWINLQIALDLTERTYTIQFGEPGTEQRTAKLPFRPNWNGVIELVVLRSGTNSAGSPRPAIEFDNLAIADLTNLDDKSRTNEASTQNKSRDQDASAISKTLSELVGTDSDFELQTQDAPPSAPWNAGPNSVVKILPRAQSPDHSQFPPGILGIHMPNRGEYDGFGCSLPTTWKPETQQTLQASFEFNCADAAAGGNGTWRFYIGHGPGNSAAVELFLNDQQLFSRSGDARTPVGPLKVGQWYRVALELNLKDRKFKGQARSLDGAANNFEWSSDFASGWDGTIDHTFIDSYGHIGGVRPALDVDNYRVAPPQAAAAASSLEPANVATAKDDATAKRQRVSQLRQQLTSLKESLKADAATLERDLTNGPFDMAYAIAEGTPHNANIQLRGEPTQPGAVVPRGFIKILGGQALPSDAAGSGRLPLADWLTRDVAHLSARVMVNRLWQFHFGRGLVPTPNDFGVRGQPPTHPELLDQLANDFIQCGWSIKTMHRQIMLSKAYQQASVWPGSDETSVLSRDFYVGFARRRLSAEEIRDSILSVSGLLDNSPGTAHPFAAPTTWGYSQHAPFSAVYDHDKRSIYLMTQRLKRHPFLALFDGSDPNASTAVRLGTTVPTQALYFMNDPFVHRASTTWAGRLVGSTASDYRLMNAYTGALQRGPTDSELQEAGKFIDAYNAAMKEAGVTDDPPGVQATAALLRTLMGSNEFLHVD